MVTFELMSAVANKEVHPDAAPVCNASTSCTEDNLLTALLQSQIHVQGSVSARLYCNHKFMYMGQSVHGSTAITNSISASTALL